jgi:hypothetical protein
VLICLEPITWRKELSLKNKTLFTDLCRYLEKVTCKWFNQLEDLKIIGALNGESDYHRDRPELVGR